MKGTAALRQAAEETAPQAAHWNPVRQAALGWLALYAPVDNAS